MIAREMPEYEERIGSVDEPLLPATDIVARYEALSVADHPLFVDLASKPVDLSALWLLVANMRAGISSGFVVWLAMTIARVEDRRIGSLVAKQLDDELGSGQFPQIHSVLLDRFVAALEPWRLDGPDSKILDAGQHLLEEAGSPFYAKDPYESVGALISGEIFANRMDHCLGVEIRRQDKLSEEALTWLTIHETLEEHHAQDSGELALLIPQKGPELAATWRGAEAQWSCLWRFLDRVQATRVEHASRARSS
ncbi:MAG: pyrroloquinoline quinone [Myxococcaceae bacterium]|nr:pyrroloquinoline quinone [Myxococcaceae bacterium]